MYDIKRTIGHSVLGPDGSITMRSVIDLMQDCCGFQLDNEEVLEKYFKETNTGIFLVYRQLDFIRLPHYAETITVRTYITEFKSLYAVRNTFILAEDGTPIIISYAIGAFVNLASGRPFRLPKDVGEKISLTQPYEMEYTDRKILLPEIEPVKKPSVVVGKWLIDANHHINNARYVALAEEYVPADFAIKRMRIEYKTAAKYMEEIIPLVYNEENQIVVNLTDTEGMTFVIVQFIK